MAVLDADTLPKSGGGIAGWVDDAVEVETDPSTGEGGGIFEPEIDDAVVVDTDPAPCKALATLSNSVERDIFWSLIAKAIQLKEMSWSATLFNRIVNP